jgi:hypothetical protein
MTTVVDGFTERSLSGRLDDVSDDAGWEGARRARGSSPTPR